MPAYLFIEYVLFCIAGMLAARFAREGLRAHLGQFLLHAGAAVTVLLAIAFNWSHPATLAVLTLLVMGPWFVTATFQRAIQQALGRSDFDRAVELARRRVILLPFEAYRRQQQMFEALKAVAEQARLEGREPASVLLDVSGRPGLEPLREYAALQDLSQRAAQRDWSGVVELYERGIKLPDDTYDAAARALVVRAYCELGALDRALKWLSELEQHRRWRALRRQLHVAWLAVLATGGRRQAVDEMLGRQMRNLPPPAALSWRARAAWAAGQPQEAQALLSPLLASDALPEPLRLSLEDRFRQMRQAPPSRSPADEQALDRLERLVRTDALLFQSVRRSVSSRPVVGGLMLVVLSFFTSTWILADPARSRASFAAMGALLAAEPWRLLTSLFMHDGWTHLLLNSLALIVFGNVVEGIYRRWATLSIFLVSGLVANLVAVVLRPDVLLVGASGAILGWFGALMAVVLKAGPLIPRTWRTSLLRSFAVILVLELLVGLLYERISLSAHITGFVVGLLMGLLLPPRGLQAIARGEPAETA